MVRALTFFGLLAAFAVVFPVIGGAAPARTTANTATFTDSRGEDPQGPDIATVEVSNDNTGLISFKLNVPNQAQLSGEKLIDLVVDADNNKATGDPDPLSQGADYAIEFFQQQANLFQWDGQTYSRSAAGPSQASLVFTDSPTGPTISINATELGNTKKLNLAATVISGIRFDDTGNLDFTNAHADFAPDLGHGLYAYDVKVTALKLLATKFRKVPSRPVAGRVFSVRMVAVRNDTGAALQNGTVKCTAKVGGRALTARTHKIVNREAQCAWLIPASARGQTIRGSISVVFEGLKATKTFTAPVG